MSTSQEITAKLDAMRASLDPTADNFNESVVLYTALMEEHTKAIREENATQLDDAKTKLGMGIDSLVASLNLATLLVEKVTRVVWEYVPGETDDDEDTIHVYINPTARKRTTSTKSTTASTPSTSNGDRRDLTAIFDANATVEEKSKAAEIDALHGTDGSEPNPKKLNSQMWSLKNRIAERASKETVSTSS